VHGFDKVVLHPPSPYFPVTRTPTLHLDNMEQSYVRPVSEVLKHFNVTEANGLSSAQVIESRKRYGSNCKSPIEPQDAPAPN
jgi:hypothetical protein